MTEKKTTDKETTKKDTTEDKSKDKSKDNPKDKDKPKYKRKKQLSYDNVNSIIDWMERERIKPEDVSTKYGCSVSIARKLFNILRNTEWKPLPDNPTPSKGYMIPKSIDNVVDSVMYDKGFYR